MIGKPIQYKSVDEGTTFTINDRTYETLMVSPYYFICVDAVDGLFGADISYEAHPIPGIAGQVVGEVSGDVIRRGKTVTLSGMIYGRGQAELYEGAFYLMNMFAETDGLRKLLFNPWNYGSSQLYVKCKVSQDLAVVMQTDSQRHRWPWTVGLRADDPRLYSTGGAVTPSFQQ